MRKVPVFVGMTYPQPRNPEVTIQVACQDSGRNVIRMDWIGNVLLLWMSPREIIAVRPRMEELYRDVREALVGR